MFWGWFTLAFVSCRFAGVCSVFFFFLCFLACFCLVLLLVFHVCVCVLLLLVLCCFLCFPCIWLFFSMCLACFLFSYVILYDVCVFCHQTNKFILLYEQSFVAYFKEGVKVPDLAIPKPHTLNCIVHQHPQPGVFFFTWQPSGIKSLIESNSRRRVHVYLDIFNPLARNQPEAPTKHAETSTKHLET